MGSGTTSKLARHRSYAVANCAYPSKIDAIALASNRHMARENDQCQRMTVARKSYRGEDMATVFLTGASGFLGGHLLRELCAAGCEVRALSRRSESDALIAELGGVPVRAELADVESLKAAQAGCEAVFHAAADTSMWRPQAAAQTATNLQGTENLLQAAESAGVQAFVHTSSVSAYSHLAHATLDESVPQRGAESWINYERTKYLGEQAVRRSSVPWIVFNPSHILGPGDHHNWARLIILVDREKLPGIPPGIGSFADVREIASAQVRAWQRQRFGQAYVVGGEHASFVDFVHRVGAVLGKRTPRGATPAWALMTFARLADAWSRVTGKEPDVTPESAMLTCWALRVDSSKAKRELDYIETPLDTLLADTLAWMRQEGLVGAEGNPANRALRVH
ncbi:NAD-dependent epimerase/dehydratase family protein [Paraburkholderia sp. SIMBA_030]|uniref:NAD-dependent epimerase/dehydratase family protein n=2 Tax=Pseudomonadota TaxID=1224 RepID=UPI00397D0CBA